VEITIIIIYNILLLLYYYRRVARVCEFAVRASRRTYITYTGAHSHTHTHTRIVHIIGVYLYNIIIISYYIRERARATWQRETDR